MIDKLGGFTHWLFHKEHRYYIKYEIVFGDDRDFVMIFTDHEAVLTNIIKDDYDYKINHVQSGVMLVSIPKD